MNRKSTKRPPFFERVKDALKEGIAHARGELPMKTTVVEVPDTAPNRSPQEVRAIRDKIGFSQRAFARLISVSVKTVQSWEQGLRRPDGAALRMMQLVELDPHVVDVLGWADQAPKREPQSSRKLRQVSSARAQQLPRRHAPKRRNSLPK